MNFLLFIFANQIPKFPCPSPIEIMVTNDSKWHVANSVLLFRIVMLILTDQMSNAYPAQNATKTTFRTIANQGGGSTRSRGAPAEPP